MEEKKFLITQATIIKYEVLRTGCTEIQWIKTNAALLRKINENHKDIENSIYLFKHYLRQRRSFT